jgi:hypothetical protein
MTNLIDSILNKDYVTADSLVAEEFESIMRNKLFEAKKHVAAKMCEMDVSKEKPEYDSIEDMRGTQRPIQDGKGNKEQTVNTVGKTDKQPIKEEELSEARVKILKARVRNGKVQRRKKISNVAGFKLGSGGQLQRMSPAERRNRKMGQKRGKMKRKSKMRMALMKRKRSLRKRASIGL